MRTTMRLFAIAVVWLGSAASLAAQGQVPQKRTAMEQALEEATPRQLAIEQELTKQAKPAGDPLREGDGPTAANLLAIYRDWFSSAPFTFGNASEPYLEANHGSLQKIGRGRWQKSDVHGQLTVYAGVGTDAGHFRLEYYPRVASAFGDAALAALIAKSEKVESGATAGEVRIRLATSGLSDGPHTGTKEEWLTFSLDGGLWKETEVFIDWK